MDVKLQGDRADGSSARLAQAGKVQKVRGRQGFHDETQGLWQVQDIMNACAAAARLIAAPAQENPVHIACADLRSSDSLELLIFNSQQQLPLPYADQHRKTYLFNKDGAAASATQRCWLSGTVVNEHCYRYIANIKACCAARI